MNKANVIFLGLLTHSSHPWGRGPPTVFLVTQTLLSIIHSSHGAKSRSSPGLISEYKHPGIHSNHLKILVEPSLYNQLPFIHDLLHKTPMGGFLFITCLLKKQGLWGMITILEQFQDWSSLSLNEGQTGLRAHLLICR